MTEKDFINKPIVSMADGAKVGTVKDLIFHGLDLDALVVKGERGEGLLPYRNLGTNGPDAITIESYTLVDWNAGPGLGPDSKSIHDLRKLSVVDSNGKALGHLHDFTLDSLGHVDEIDVRTEGVFGIGSDKSLIAGNRVRALGPTVITVDSIATP